MASKDLRLMIEKKDLDGIDEYINNGGSVNGMYDKGKTPLFLAIQGSYRRRALSVSNDSQEEDEIILRLIKAGGNLHSTIADLRFTPLMVALQLKLSDTIILELLKAGSDINAECSSKQSPLELAILNNYNKELIYKLIEAGADVNHVNLFEETPLYYALGYHTDKYELVKMFLNAGANVNAGNCCNNITGRVDCKFSCQEGKCKNKKLIDLLVNKGLDLTIRDYINNGTLIHGVNCNYLISLVIKCGVSIESKDENGETPLIYRSRYHGDFDNVKSLLIKFNADPNNVNNKAQTPLHYAVRYGSTEICKLLLYHGGDIFAKDIDNNTPLDLMLNYIEMVLIHGKRERVKELSLIKYYLLYVDENNLYDCFRNHNNSEISEEKFESFLVDFKHELSKMKCTFIKGDLTFYDFCRLKRFYKSKPIDMYLDELNYNFHQIQEMFPIYHDFIITRIKDNLIKNNKRHLLQCLEGVIIRSLPIDENDPYLNYDCKRLIARYFNREQLVTLFQASIED